MFKIIFQSHHDILKNSFYIQKRKKKKKRFKNFIRGRDNGIN